MIRLRPTIALAQAGLHFKPGPRKMSSLNGFSRLNAVLLIAFSIAAGALAPSLSHAASSNPAETFVQQSIDKVFAILNDASDSEQQRRTQFRGFMLLLTDTHRIGAFTLGRYANDTSTENLAAFESAFTDYLVAVYEARLTNYRGQTVRVSGSTARSEDDVVVNADVVNPKTQSPGIKAAFRVRKTLDGRSVVTDIQIEGVWLALSERSEFTAFLQQHSGRIEDLISELRRQTQTLIPASISQ